MAEAPPSDTAPPFAIFRARDAVDLAQSGHMYAAQGDGDAGMSLSAELGGGEYLSGTSTKVLYSRPGMSLTYVWFKSGFPLPRHSHNADCLYFIIAGSIRMGAEDLGPGDGFFLGVDVPYTYVPGEKGVELLEFRTSDHFDIKLVGNTQAWWAKAMDMLKTNAPNWPGESEPSGVMKVG